MRVAYLHTSMPQYNTPIIITQELWTGLLTTCKRIRTTIVRSLARPGMTWSLYARWAFTHKRIQPSFVIYNDLSVSYEAPGCTTHGLFNFMVILSTTPSNPLFSGCVGAFTPGEGLFGHHSSWVTIVSKCYYPYSLFANSPTNFPILLPCSAAFIFNVRCTPSGTLISFSALVVARSGLGLLFLVPIGVIVTLVN